ncbi:unnamed protein product [Rotaria magnacalcarata]|uniref:Acid phosphatase n=1 Tax=Rotaria magnacalcarata TaxID=392030 RepID=A0A814EH12_9BILA|nr:unnamed protein product [Rotaria magnacalcarata]CAF4484032.1 unnamed protein product [Rotaria magnacalcarata]
MENKDYKYTIRSSAWQSIIQRSASFLNMYAITHPSQPNYISMIAGSTLNYRNNDYFSTNELTIIDLLNKAQVSWKSYQENYASLSTTTSPNCNDAMELEKGLYVRRHNPFMFKIDLTNKQLPQFSLYTPNIKNSGHDTDLNYAGNYLQKWLDIHLNNSAFTNGTLLIVTFDEDNNNPDRTNHIAAFMWGIDYLYSEVKISGTFNHYSLLKLLEENWGLGNLGRNDVTASSIMNIWRPTAYSNNTNNDTISTSTPATSTASRNDVTLKISVMASYLFIMIY